MLHPFVKNWGQQAVNIEQDSIFFSRLLTLQECGTRLTNIQNWASQSKGWKVKVKLIHLEEEKMENLQISTLAEPMAISLILTRKPYQEHHLPTISYGSLNIPMHCSTHV